MVSSSSASRAFFSGGAPLSSSFQHDTPSAVCASLCVYIVCMRHLLHHGRRPRTRCSMPYSALELPPLMAWQALFGLRFKGESIHGHAGLGRAAGLPNKPGSPPHVVHTTQCSLFGTRVLASPIQVQGLVLRVCYFFCVLAGPPQ